MTGKNSRQESCEDNGVRDFKTRVVLPSWVPSAVFFLTCLLVGLKVCGVADYGWLYAFMPLWVPFAFAASVTLILMSFVFAIIAIVMFCFIIFMTIMAIHDIFCK